MAQLSEEEIAIGNLAFSDKARSIQIPSLILVYTAPPNRKHNSEQCDNTRKNPCAEHHELFSLHRLSPYLLRARLWNRARTALMYGLSVASSM